MPLGDGTGPRGMGMMTGRGTGYCIGNRDTRYYNQGPAFGRRVGQGFGLCTGRGRGRGQGSGSGRGRGTGRGSGQGRNFFRW
ncbi:MAG: DUF5320 domain-containing protein [Dehalococcoidia bacterium]